MANFTAMPDRLPWITWWIDDWQGGTRWMTRLERGAYFDLLMFQVSNICFSLDDAMMILGEDFEKCWPRIAAKFVEVDGKYHNKKMREVVEDRLSYIETRRSNRLGKKKKHKKNTSKTHVSHVGGGGGSGNGIEVKKESAMILPFDTDTFREAWADWKAYKKTEHRFSFKSPKTEQTALNELAKDAGDEPTAIAMIKQAIAKNWKGLYELKSNGTKPDAWAEARKRLKITPA